MKVSVSLPDEDVEFLDVYASEHNVTTRSAALHRAIDLLRTAQLGDAYAEAWQEWDESGESEIWDTTAADGLTP